MTTHQQTPVPAAGERRPWIEPQLTRHASLTAMTQQDIPIPGPDEDPVRDSVMRALAVPGSQGFFP